MALAQQDGRTGACGWSNFFRRSSHADVRTALSRPCGLRRRSATGFRFVVSKRRATLCKLSHFSKPDLRGCDVGIAITATCASLRQAAFVQTRARVVSGIRQTACEHDVFKCAICGTYRGRRAYEVYWPSTNDPVVLAFGRERERAGESR